MADAARQRRGAERGDESRWSYHGNAGPCRWPRGRSPRCPPGSGRQGAPPSPGTGLRYPGNPAGTRTDARSGGGRLLIISLHHYVVVNDLLQLAGYSQYQDVNVSI